ncbi:MAG TPA: helix-turn-helix domain-containing protein [Ilumatobacter sp.]|nr:helix-turn-helix domain-containing protein [Ilumatobacter sp.]
MSTFDKDRIHETLTGQRGLLITVPDAAAVLGLHERTLYTLAANDTAPVPVVRFGARVVRFRLADLRVFLGLAPLDTEALAS